MIKVGDLISYYRTYTFESSKRYTVVQKITTNNSIKRYWGLWNKDITSARKKLDDYGASSLSYIEDKPEFNVKIEMPKKIDKWKGLI